MIGRQHAKPVYVLASGGTGGHLFPALSLGDYFTSKGRRVFLVTDERGAKFPGGTFFDKIFVVNINRKAPFFKKFVFYTSLVLQTLRCLLIYRKIRPSIVVGFGGYSSAPAVYAAQILGIPTIVHEQNAILGRANRFLAKRAYRVATSFPNTRGAPPHSVVTGNPVRPNILSLKDCPYTPPDPNEPFNLLIIGGSQGAKIFSEVIPNTLTHLPLNIQKRLKVAQQCRPEYVTKTQSFYRQSFLDVEVKSFFDDMDERYKAAHLIIARSGASTVAELSIVGRPAILVPFAAALESDQTYNAERLVAAGAAWMIGEKEFTPETLGKKLEELMTHPEPLQDVAAAVRKFSYPDASKNLANNVAQIVSDLLTI
ncbi:MAG: undecaprenyldiphospho-muramoylpentapeptide beta-N-acetylglucosaminyltransferase [Alphaproteobacteria bacterium]|nr:undecaprenyldiphospho-muramoylpentapeptide beta-N-acetylglucosaminyltransferase [Alphaproteobacteria bacterium]